MRERPSRLAGGAMGRLFASICGANLTSRAPRINKAREPELECGGARLKPRRCARIGEGDGPSPSPRPKSGARSVRRRLD